MEMKFKVHLYHKVATALSPSLRGFLRKTLSEVELYKVIKTLVEMTEKAGAVTRVTVRQEEEENGE